MRAVFASLTVVLLISVLGCQKSETLPDKTPTTSESSAESKKTITKTVELKHVQEVVAATEESEHEEGNADQVHGPGFGRGPGMGRGFRGGRGPRGGGMAGMRPDMTTIHSMFEHRDKIKRTVKLLPNGAEAVTESDDKKVAALLQDHVPNMDGRVLGNQPLPPMTFHPVFVGLIENAQKYSLEYEDTPKGVKVTYRSDDPYVVMLVQEHAKLVSRFIKNGHDEIHADYELPKFDKQKAAAQAKALAARGTLFKRLSGRLKQVMQEQGPASAIEVCSREASQLATQVGEDLGVKIGRTSLKLRNANNTPPAWANELLAKTPTESMFVDLPDGQLAALLPIRLETKCITCHGPVDQIADDVKMSLKKLYPNDKATGFQEGDLRGWFWVEVPAK